MKFEANLYERGHPVTAKYLESGIPDYDGNPLIEALPPILDLQGAAARLAYFPDFDERMREAPDHIRHHYIRTRMRFFTPLNIHLDLERRFSCAIRGGLLERNPLKQRHWQKVQNAINSNNYVDQYGDCEEYDSTAALGFNMIGASGNGKSQGISRILNTYPQVIYHKDFKGRNFTESQLVWLKLDCPFDGSTKGLCINLLQATDSILKTDYQENYTTKKPGTDELIVAIEEIVSNHHLGVLVIDEIQRLSFAKSGGAEKMLNFFVQLVNTIGVPVVLVGTYKAMSIFNGSVSQMRRGSGQGDVIWDLMDFDDQWDLFIKSMWRYELTKYRTPDDKLDKLSEVLYEETQGIIDLAIKAFTFAQERAIEDGIEKITSGVIRSVVHDKFKMLRPVLKALRENDKTILTKFEDIYSTLLGSHIKILNQKEIGKNSNSHSLTIAGKIAQEPEIKLLLDDSQNNVNIFLKAVSNPKSSTIVLEDNSSTEEGSKSKKRTKKTSDNNSPAVLPKLLKNSHSNNKNSSYDVLKDAGFIHSDENFTLSDDQN